MADRALALVPDANKRKRSGDIVGGDGGASDALAYAGGDASSASDPSLALVVPATGGPAITKQEYEKRLKDADELEKKLAYITQNVPTIVTQVQGSAAGAGSGTFHTYANGRRREKERVEAMEREARERAREEEMKNRLSSLQAIEEEKTAKKRATREKRKEKKRKKSGTGGEEVTAEAGDGGEDGDSRGGGTFLAPSTADLD